MKSYLCFLCLLALLVIISGKSTSHVRHLIPSDFLLDLQERVSETQQDEGILPTYITFEANSQEQEGIGYDEDMGIANEEGDAEVDEIDEKDQSKQQRNNADSDLLDRVEEVDASTESEIPTDLDYSEESQETAEEAAKTALDDAELQNDQGELPKIFDYNPEELETSKELDAADQGRPTDTNPMGNQKLDPQGRAQSMEDDGNSASHIKGRMRKQKKNQRNKKRQVRENEARRSDLNTRKEPEHRENKSKKTSLLGINPVQIRATRELFPESLLPEDQQDHVTSLNSCEGFRCKRGKTCRVNEQKRPECVCQEAASCSTSATEMDHVCGTDNKTYDTSCQLFATKCNLEGTKRGHRLHLDYTGSCKYIPPCSKAELDQFPLRMRDWLKNVLFQLYEQDAQSHRFLTSKQRFRVQKIYDSEHRLHAGDHPIDRLARDFVKNYHMYIYPVHWQFAQMDQHPKDRFLSHSELAPLRAPLVPMEHCTSPFFQECDHDKDKQISFREWGHCFGINDEDLDVDLLF